MYSGFGFKMSISESTVNIHGYTFYSSFISRNSFKFFISPTFLLEIASIHTKKHIRPIHSFCSPLSGMNGKDRIALIVRAGEEKENFVFLDQFFRFFELVFFK